MRVIRFLLIAIVTIPALAQRQELGLTLGRFVSSERAIFGGTVDIGGGTGLQADYGIRIVDSPAMALLGYVHLLASPQRKIESLNLAATRDIATLYLTPGIRLKFAPDSRVAPWVELGGGYGQYEQSTERLDGQPNQAPRRIHRGVIEFGGGIDVRVVRFLSLRGEVRNFYTGNPSFNVLTSGSGQNNVVLGGGFMIRF